MTSSRQTIEQSWIDMLKMEALKRHNPRMTHKEISERLKCSKSKVDSVFTFRRYLDIPPEFRKQWETVAAKIVPDNHD
jgi:hypothetical protein